MVVPEIYTVGEHAAVNKWTTSVNWFRATSGITRKVTNCNMQKGFCKSLTFMEERRREKETYVYLRIRHKRNREKVNQKLRERLPWKVWIEVTGTRARWFHITPKSINN